MRALGGLVVLSLLGCVDLGLDEARPYACVRGAPLPEDEDLGPCAEGWTCGYEGRCVDPDAGEPRLCLEASDCAPEWRCGLAVHGAGDAGPFGRCQDTRVAAAYPCEDDSWCEQGWRCGPERRCVDARDEALVPFPAEVAPAVRVSPALPAPLVDATVASSAPGQVEVGLLTASGVTLIREDGALFSASLPFDGGHLVRLVGPTRSELSLVVVGDGRTVRAPLDTKGVPTAPVDFAWPPFRARGVSFDGVARGQMPTERLVAWNDRTITTLSLPSGRTDTLPPPPGVIERVEGHAGWRSTLVAATSAGAFVSTDDGGWRPLELGLKADCGRGAQELRVLGSLGDALELAVVSSGGANACLSLLGTTDAGALQHLGDSTVCAQSQRVTELRPLAAGQGASVDCVSDAGVEQTISVCRSDVICPSPLDSSPGPGAALRARADWPDVHLDLIVDRRGFPAVEALDALLPARASRTRPVVGSFEFAMTREVDDLVSPTLTPDASLVVVARRGPDAGLERFGEVSGAGLGVAPSAVLAPAPLAGIPGSTWWLADDATIRASLPLQLDGGPGPLARFTPLAPLTKPPPLAVRWRADGGALLVVASDDALLSGELGTGGPLELRLVPASRSVISSVSVAPAPVELADGGSVEVTGYAIALGRLHRFEARNRVWRSDELGLANLAVSTWYDASRARVGVDTGEVLGLPSRVPLSRRVPSPPATQFVWACRQTWVVTATGVHRLTPGDGGLASWVRDEELHRALGPFTDEARITLTSFGDELVATTAEGVVARRRLQGCPPR
ncbi:MAG: hypothetical protein MUC96_30245 [Myxococcaceae bacterium]|jgi:hypothetical protein|nr:hypothetical protein [Myxococcaceae bacterium]